MKQANGVKDMHITAEMNVCHHRLGQQQQVWTGVLQAVAKANRVLTSFHLTLI